MRYEPETFRGRFLIGVVGALVYIWGAAWIGLPSLDSKWVFPSILSHIILALSYLTVMVSWVGDGE